MSESLLSLHPKAMAVVENVRKVIVGKDDAVSLLVSCLLAGGNALLEDKPGLGKTTLAESLARSLCGDPKAFKRIQCTPDLLPADITGFSRYLNDGAAQFCQGPVFAHIVLADELNRATPRTQSALLEAMNERQVTVDGVTHKLPEPFMLIATQNPQEYAGTFPLPIAQLDRFMIVLSLDYASETDERRILSDRLRGNPLDPLRPVSDPAEIARICRLIERDVTVSPEIVEYVVRLTRNTRTDPDIVSLGASPRGALQLMRMAKAYAFLRERDFVLPDDIKALAHHVLIHRLTPAEDRSAETKDVMRRFTDDLLAKTEAPRVTRR